MSQFYCLRQTTDVKLGIHFEFETEVPEGTAVLSLFDYSEPRITSSENQTPASGVTERSIRLE